MMFSVDVVKIHLAKAVPEVYFCWYICLVSPTCGTVFLLR